MTDDTKPLSERVRNYDEDHYRYMTRLDRYRFADEIAKLEAENAELRQRLKNWNCGANSCTVYRLEKELNDVKQRYSDLLYGVETKHPGESRHETALRYIRSAERGDNPPPQSALSDHPKE